MDSIYRFQIEDRRFAFDTESCFLFEIDEITHRILDYYGQVPGKEIVKRLEGEFNAQELADVIRELDILRDDGNILVEGKEKPSGSTKEDLRSVSLQLSKHSLPGFFMPEARAKEAIDFIIMKSGAAKDLRIEFLTSYSFIAPDVIKSSIDYAKRQGKRFGKAFRFSLYLTDIQLSGQYQNITDQGQLHLTLDFGDLKPIGTLIRYLDKQKGRQGLDLQRIRKLATQGNGDISPLRLIFSPHSLNFSPVVLKLFDLGIKDIAIDHSSLLFQGDDKLEKIKREYQELAEKYLELTEKDEELNLDPFKSLIQKLYAGDKCERRCQGTLGNLAISAEGDLFPCRRLLDRKEFLLGNLNPLSNYNLTLEENFRDFSVEEAEKCSGCWARYSCGGGCTALVSYPGGGRYQIAEPYCKLEKHLFQLSAVIFSTLGDRGKSLKDIATSPGTFSFPISLGRRKEKMRLRSILEEDISTIFQWNASHFASYFLNDGLGAKSSYERAQDLEKEKPGQMEMILETEGGVPLGLLKFHLYPNDKRAEISLFLPDKEMLLDPAYHQLGLLAFGTLFKRMGLNRLYTTLLESEKEYVEYMEQLGFRDEGHLKEQLFYKGKYHDMLTLGLLRDELKRKK